MCRERPLNARVRPIIGAIHFPRADRNVSSTQSVDAGKRASTIAASIPAADRAASTPCAALPITSPFVVVAKDSMEIRIPSVAPYPSPVSAQITKHNGDKLSNRGYSLVYSSVIYL